MTVDKKKNTQILVTFPKDLLDDIEEYWHEKKIANRSESIRKLVKLGLEKEN